MKDFIKLLSTESKTKTKTESQAKTKNILLFL